MAKDRSHLYLMPIVVPEGTEWDDGAHRWASIPADWQDEMAELLERGIDKPDDSPGPVTLEEVGLVIADYLAINGITQAHADHLREQFKQALQRRRAAVPKTAPIVDPELAAIFS